MREYIDLVLIVPLEEELEQVTQVFELQENRSTLLDYRHLAKSPVEDLKVLIVLQENMGKQFASQATQQVLEEYDVGMIICVGIAGGLSSDFKLGDVCFSGDIIDVYNNAKAEDIDGGGIDYQLTPTHYECDRQGLASFKFLKTQPDTRSIYVKWQETGLEFARQLGLQRIPDKSGRPQPVDAPKAGFGTIFCGVVSKSEDYNKKLKNIDRKAIALETETGGVFEAVKGKSIPVLAVRGICDYADRQKNELEKSTGGDLRKLAARNAANFVYAQLSNSRFVAFLKRRKISNNGNDSLGNYIPK